VVGAEQAVAEESPFLVATAGIPVHFAGVVLLVVACLAFPNSLPALVLASVALIALVVLCTPGLTAVQRARFRVHLPRAVHAAARPLPYPHDLLLQELVPNRPSRRHVFTFPRRVICRGRKLQGSTQRSDTKLFLIKINELD
jgi:hypothetical protein